jgi:glycosyltransferase involved in cell wall biosynthesis
MRIAVVAPNLASNAMARTCPIARVLERNHEVEIVGFDDGQGFYEPWRGEFDYESFSVGHTPLSLARNVHRASEYIQADLVYAFRPCMGSLGVGIYHQRRTGTPLVLDIEDLVRFTELARWHRLYQAIRYSPFPDSEFYSDLLRRFADRADAVTVTSSLLAQRYGGTRIPYGPDESAFSPGSVADVSDIRAEFGDGHYALFAGTIRPHKGLDVLARAVARAEADIDILILGYDPDDQLPELRELSGGRVRYLGSVPHGDVPRYLKFADVVPLPQRDTRYTRAQIPEKTFEAMAMAKPIIASATADLPEILDGCGFIVEPGDPDALASQLDYVIQNPEESEEMGRRAREKYVAEYGWDRMEERLEDVLRDVVQ